MVFLLKERVDTNLLAIIFWLIWSKRNSDRCGEDGFLQSCPITKSILMEHVFSTEGAAGLGAIICDASRKVLGALSQRINKPISAATVEALACHRVMFFAKDEGVLECIF